MLRSPALAAGCLLFSLTAGCGNKNPDDEDMGAADMRHDLKPASDLAMAHEDLGPAEKPKLTGLPMCITEAITAEQLYTKTVGPNCRVGMCHMNAVDAKAMTDWWVNKTALKAPMILVKPGELNESYVMYKIMGQHTNPLVGGMGVRMPKGKDPLSDDHLCNFINWIKGGAG